MKLILPIFIAMLSGVNCQRIDLPPIFDDALYKLLSKTRLGINGTFSALEPFSKANSEIEVINKAYPNITAAVEKDGKDPEKLVEKAFIDLKNTLARASTELYSVTSVIKFGFAVYKKTVELENVLIDSIDDFSFIQLIESLSEDLRIFQWQYNCIVDPRLFGCPKKM